MDAPAKLARRLGAALVGLALGACGGAPAPPGWVRLAERGATHHPRPAELVGLRAMIPGFAPWAGFPRPFGAPADSR